MRRIEEMKPTVVAIPTMTYRKACKRAIRELLVGMDIDLINSLIRRVDEAKTESALCCLMAEVRQIEI